MAVTVQSLTKSTRPVLNHSKGTAISRSLLRGNFAKRDWTRRRCSSNILAASSSNKGAVVILPGFLSGASQYDEMAKNFKKRGRPVEIVPIKAWQWMSTIAGGSFDFYLELAHATVTQAYEEHGSLALVGHSAGGWLARLLLGEQPYNGRVWGDANKVHTLLCLGTPHLSLENYPYGRIPEQLKLTPKQAADAKACPSVSTSSLCFTNHFYPTAHSIPGVHIVCVVGKAAKGENTNAFPLMPGMFATDRSRLQFVYDSYVASCGRGDVWGDGVCPLESGALPGADIIQLADVWHQPTPGRKWYGSKEIVKTLDSCIGDLSAVAAHSRKDK